MISLIRKVFFPAAVMLLFCNANAQCWSKLASGWFHNVGIQVDGTMWAWGKNDVGQLGDGTFINRNTPVQIGSAADWTFVAAADNHSVAIKSDGSLWAWGLNDSGQLGDGSTITKNTPVQIGTDTDWQFVSLGTKFSTALKSNGELWTWGESGSNQLGNGTSAFDEYEPVQIGSSSNWALLSAGQSSTLGLKLDGTLWGWGSHANGALANGLITETTQFPTQSGPESNWTMLKTGNSTTLALKADKSLWSWGGNTFGALGTNAMSNDPAENPVLVNGSSEWGYVAMGRFHSYAIKIDGSLWIWGRNQSGQIGDNSTVNRFAPVQIGAEMQWRAAMGGEQHSIALSANHTLWAWGSNSFGQLGDGSNSNKLVPSSIGIPCNLETQQFVKKSLSIYPNPFNEALNVAIDLPQKTAVVVTIYNSQGQNICQIDSFVFDKSIAVPTTNLSSGLYFITVNYNGNLLSASAIKY